MSDFGTKCPYQDPTKQQLIFRYSIFSTLAAYSLHTQTYSTWFLAVIIAFVIWCLTGGWKTIYLLIKTAPRDVKAILIVIKMLWQIGFLIKKNATVPVVFAGNVKKNANKTCFLYQDQIWTYKNIDEYSNQVANVFQKAGYKKGDVVAILVESCPQYVALYLGLAKIGICSALINYNLKQKPLVHSITVSEAKALIYSSQYSEAIEEIRASLNKELKYFRYGEIDLNDTKSTPLINLLNQSSRAPPQAVVCNQKDKLMYIYTSGTTGLPKPAVINHLRYILISLGLSIGLTMKATDIIYTSLPLYHAAGGILGCGQAVVSGITVVIRNKFSASNYWDDCIKYKCTVAQYIGEICRYLLAVPSKPSDKQHTVRLLVGNGLRPQIWKEFQNRFGVERICEIYGSTEGNANLGNMDCKPYAIGFIPSFISWIHPLALIKIDETTNKPLRNKNGLCIRCKIGEPGELVGKISKWNPIGDFTGYVTKKDTEKKIIHDVFKKGDRAFASGDLVIMDDFGYIYFKDRLGDTFRWKGENVSTMEVEGAVLEIIGLKECVVYGVEVPGCEGRAGMAAILDQDGNFDLKLFAEGVNKSLPVYAKPLFVRIVTELDITGTYKLRKTDLQKQGMNPKTVENDQLYVMNIKASYYEPLTEDIYKNICNGTYKL